MTLQNLATVRVSSFRQLMVAPGPVGGVGGSMDTTIFFSLQEKSPSILPLSNRIPPKEGYGCIVSRLGPALS